jgi:predicted DNA-binding transcriptional regulator YafY
MFDIQTKVKRQIEILGLALDNPEVLKDTDFSVLFERDIPTIKRDMQDLRAYGVDIHSEKKRGICVTSAIEQSRLRDLIAQYLGICNASSGADKATGLLVKQLRAKALRHVVVFQRCIEQHMAVVIDYQKEEDELEEQREICPLLLFSSEGSWRVLAINDGVAKQYHLNKVARVRPGEKKFKSIPKKEIDEMFRYSFRSWVGTEKHHIRIRLSEEWAKRIKPRQLMETQVITEEEDGSVILESTVNSLTEVASWVVSRGRGVEVLEPSELRTKVIDLARGALENYRAE